MYSCNHSYYKDILCNWTIFPFIAHSVCLKTHVCWIGIGIYKMCMSNQGIGLLLQPKIVKAKAIKSAHDKYIKNKYWLLIVRNSKSFFFLHSADHNQKYHFLYTNCDSAEVCKKKKIIQWFVCQRTLLFWPENLLSGFCFFNN